VGWHGKDRRLARRKVEHPSTLVFQHIPKTAGVSVRSVISSNFNIAEIIHVPDGLWRDAAFAAEAVERYRFVHGHLHYEFVKTITHRTRVVTFLRDPVERVLSLFYFLRNQDPAGVVDPAVRYTIECARSLAPDEFVALRDPIIKPMVSDYQARVLLDDAQQAQPKRRWLRLVLANLERYALVGICDPDLITESMQRMTLLFGWLGAGDAPHVNKTVRPPPSEEVERARSIIESNNRVDADILQHLRIAFRNSARDEAPAEASAIETLARERERYRTGLDAVSGMALPLRCWGWHDRETDMSGRYWRCGAKLRSGLELRLPEGESFQILFQLASTHPRISVPATVVRAGARDVPSRALVVNNFWVIVVQIERRDADADGLVGIEFEFQEGDKPATCEMASDARYVTVALESIEVAVPQRTGPRTFDLLVQMLSNSTAVALQPNQTEDAAQPRRVWDPLREIESLRGDLTTIQAAREREVLEGARYIESLTQRAEAAEASCRLSDEARMRLEQVLQRIKEELCELRAQRDRDEELVQAYQEQIADLTARIRFGQESYHSLEASLERERTEGAAYQHSLVDRAERSEVYAASLKTALDLANGREKDAVRNGTEISAQAAELALKLSIREEELRALKKSMERERAETKQAVCGISDPTKHAG